MLYAKPEGLIFHWRKGRVATVKMFIAHSVETMLIVIYKYCYLQVFMEFQINLFQGLAQWHSKLILHLVDPESHMGINSSIPVPAAVLFFFL